MEIGNRNIFIVFISFFIIELIRHFVLSEINSDATYAAMAEYDGKVSRQILPSGEKTCHKTHNVFENAKELKDDIEKLPGELGFPRTQNSWDELADLNQ